jgi:hypothetical protein
MADPRTLPKAEYKTHVRHIARLMALMELGGDCRQPSDEALTYAERNWRRFLPRAIDVVVMELAEAEQAEAARQRLN